MTFPRVPGMIEDRSRKSSIPLVNSTFFGDSVNREIGVDAQVCREGTCVLRGDLCVESDQGRGRHVVGARNRFAVRT